MRAFSLGLAACCLGWGPLHADLTIVQKTEGLGQTTESVTRYKDGKTRMDMHPGTTLMMDAKTGETIQILPAQKQYLKLPASVVAAAVASMKGRRTTGSERLPLAATGRKETVAGYPAEEYSATVAGSKVSLWLTKAIPNYEQASRDLGAAFKEGPLAAMAQNLGLNLVDLPGFPVRQVNELQPGQTITTTLVSISTEPIADAAFEIPAGYQPIVSPELTPRAAVPALPRANP